MQEPRTRTDCDGSVLLAKTTDCFGAARLAMTGRPGRVKGFLWCGFAAHKKPPVSYEYTSLRRCDEGAPEANCGRDFY